MPEPGETPTPPAADATPEPAATPPPPPGDAAQEPQPDPQARLREAEARERELTDRLARLQADFENFRRRSREEAAQATGRGKEALLKALLPVLDNLDRALAHTEDAGLRMIARQLRETLSGQGIVVVDPAGEAFDAKLHEAVASQAQEGAKAGTVLHVAERGYVLDGRVLRPARVVVAQ